MMNNRRFYNFPRITVAVYFTEFKSIIVYIEALAEQVVCLKRPITSAFESSQPLLLYGANGRVCAIPTYRVYRLYDIYIYIHCYMVRCTWVWTFLRETHHIKLHMAMKINEGFFVASAIFLLSAFHGENYCMKLHKIFVQQVLHHRETLCTAMYYQFL